uniref:4,5-dioxygenase-like protein n=1 Tax=Tanacetum cinerariifolium TaxID=118510 RepID=A0A699JSP0_TANCI|nr:4,5-dioxygenase-like protein [Tanacetum cinerariifolium]
MIIEYGNCDIWRSIGLRNVYVMTSGTLYLELQNWPRGSRNYSCVSGLTESTKIINVASTMVLWVLLMLMYPEADILMCQLSVQTNNDATYHYNIDVNDYKEKAPHATVAHPWPDHLYSLHVAMGASGTDSKSKLIHKI